MSKACIRLVIKKIALCALRGYRADKYWADRLSKYALHDFRGVGNAGLSEEENRRTYLEAKKTFLALYAHEKINFKEVRILDIGCGNGFYAGVFSEEGATKYLGVDITDVLFPKLKQKFPNYTFQKLDITNKDLQGEFDLIVMIDVTQHITNHRKFSRAMRNVREHLSKSGIFIVTSWLQDNVRKSFYEQSRSINAYIKEFPNFVFSKPLPFRQKFIFSIKRRDNQMSCRRYLKRIDESL